MSIAVFQEPMNAGDADVVEMLDPIAHQACSEQGFFSDGNVAGACGDDEDSALAGEFAIAFDGDDAGESVKLRRRG